MDQQKIYDRVYEKKDTLWDNTDQIIHKIINSDFENKLINLRVKHSKGVVLNLGAGTALNLSELNKYSNIVISIDISKKGLLKAKRKYLKQEYVLAEATKLPFKNEAFDFVEGIAILHHITNYKDALIELKRCLKNDKIILCVEPGILNLQAFIVRRFFPTPFHVPEEKPFIPYLFEKELEDIYGV